MDIRTETTPNPATLKFLPGRAVMGSGMGSGTANFPDPEAARGSPLARALFAIVGINGVFLGADFVTVAKTDVDDWAALEPTVRAVIADHFASDRPVIEADMAPPTGAGGDGAAPEDDEVSAQIRELIDTRVRPAVAMDGGDIVFHGFRDGVVYLRMQGACAGCPSATATLKIGIENMLKHYIPEVAEVREAV